jgi:hypothetical protein
MNRTHRDGRIAGCIFHRISPKQDKKSFERTSFESPFTYMIKVFENHPADRRIFQNRIPGGRASMEIGSINQRKHV